jgi:hypothetical protein
MSRTGVNVCGLLVRFSGMEYAAGRDRNAGSSWGRTARCEHTLLTKPECHCPACLSELIAAHGTAVRQDESRRRLAGARRAGRR